MCITPYLCVMSAWPSRASSAHWASKLAELVFLVLNVPFLHAVHGVVKLTHFFSEILPCHQQLECSER